ncbi:MAG: elongation factor G [Candidatus Manganitrophus sp. SB1]|nr:elongation factor G [Candidatus Manganitrophus morganii]
MASISQVRNIGISAHIDSGKTTLTERILYYTGKIHRIEEVRGKSGVGAKMDSMELEREKGITIQSAATYCTWKDNVINIIDTPGHVDFTIEVERALRVLDAAILVLCGVSGVQSQSITVDRQMRRYKIPRIAFINKLDRSGADPFRVIKQLREKLGHNAHAISMPIGAEQDYQGTIDLTNMKAYYFDGDNGENIREEAIPEALKERAESLRHDLIEAMADFDDAIAEKFLEEKPVSTEELRKAIRKSTIALQFIPVMMGSAFKNKGVQLLLDGIGYYLPDPTEVTNVAHDQDNNEAKVILESRSDKPLVMLAFKLEDGRYGQLTYTRLYQGKLSKGDVIHNSTNGKKIRVSRLVRMHADEMNDIDSAEAGDIAAMFGVDCASGDTFTDGTVRYTMTSMHVPDAVISLAVWPKDKAGAGNFSKALNRFTREDPTFRVHRDEESAQTIISGMGELHLDIYMERIKREYGCEVQNGQPQVAYRETVSQRADFVYTHKKQTGGSGQFAKIGGYIEPLPADAVETFEFVDDIKGGSIPREFIPACEKGFREQVKTGTLIGFPVVGVRVVINDGASHPVDSSEMAFKICAMAAFREAYPQGRPVILEPIMKLGCEAPTEFQGGVMGLINQRRGIITGTQSNDSFVQIEAEVPLSAMFGFSTDLRSGTQGKGEFTMEFLKYAPVPRQISDELIKAYQAKRAEERK